MSREWATTNGAIVQCLWCLNLLSNTHILLMASVEEASTATAGAWWTLWVHHTSCQSILHLGWTNAMVTLCSFSIHGWMRHSFLRHRRSWWGNNWRLVRISTYHHYIALPACCRIMRWMKNLDITSHPWRVTRSRQLVLESLLVVIDNPRLLHSI